MVSVYNTSSVKKKTTLLILLSASIILGYLSFISWAVGFLIAKYLGGKTVGKSGKVRSVFVPLGKYKFHVHHWLISSGIIAIALFKGTYSLPPDLLYGFLGGLAFHGIYSYRDWYKILIPRRAQSLVAAKNLAIEKVASSTSLPEMEAGHKQLNMTSEAD